MSKELIEQLAKEHLKRGEVIADHEGYGAFVVTPNGEFVRYEDVSKMLEAYAQTQGQSIPQCNVCGDTGAIVLERTIVVAGCCGNANRDGSCCGNAIPISELEQYQEPCPNCSSSAAPIESGVKG